MWKQQLQLYYPLFSKKQKKVVDYLLREEKNVGNLTIRECASASETGQSTVLRMLEIAGYEGWSEFQKQVWKQSGISEGELQEDKEKSHKYESVLHVIQDDIKMITDMAKNMDLHKLEEVVKLINKANIIDVYGTDNSANAAAELSGRMLHLGLTSRNYSDLFFQKISAGHLGKKDIAIAFSISGKTKAVIDSLISAKESGAKTVVVTGDVNSELAQIADYIFMTPTIYFSETSKWISSRIAQIAFIDALCAAIMQSDREKFHSMLEKSTEKFEKDI